MAKKQNYTQAKGRRKTSSARVRLFKGKGASMVNDKPVEVYFSGSIKEALWQRPFKLTETLGKYYVTVKVSGGGQKSQLESFVHGVSRVLATENKDKFRPILKKAGLLTRDYRFRLRRMVGMGGKSRRQRQSPRR
ncbi:30S ribosomal protein S9 [Candidatus Woesebacteria bacterium]|nr:30S ribosomal protein S9 [Candidatus Woesebacteria bacterium]